MTILKSQLNPRSADFQANAAAMQAVVADLHEKVEKIALGGPEAARQKQAQAAPPEQPSAPARGEQASSTPASTLG